MKKVSFLRLLSLVTTVLVISCNKDLSKTDISVENTVKVEEAYKYMPEYETHQVPTKEVKRKVAELEQMVKTDVVGIRSVINIPISEAIWDIEALTNAAEGHASWQYDKLKLTKHYVYLPTTTQNGQLTVSSATIANQYNAVIQFVQEDESALSYPNANNETVFVNVSPVTAPSGDLMLEIVIGVGYGSECIGCPDPYTPVCEETTNCWHAAYKLGTCNTPSSGPQGGIDATDVLEGFINSVAQEGCPIRRSVTDIFVDNPQDGYFVNLLPKGEFFPTNHPNLNDPIVGDGYRDYLLFRTSAATPTGYNDCLSVSDINFYRDGAIQIMRSKFTSDPSLAGKYVAYCDFNYTLIPSGNQNVLHTLKFWAGDFIQ